MSLLLAACSSSGVKDFVANLPPGLRFNSVYRDVNALLAKDDFRGAREKLDQAGIGTTPTPQSLRDKDLAAARRVFEERVAQRFLPENQQLLGQGKPRQAAEWLAEALRLCAWCADVQQASTATAAIISALDSLGLKLKQTATATTPGEPEDLASHRIWLRAAQQHRGMLGDSPAIQADLEQIEAKVAGLWDSRIRNGDFKPSDLTRFRDDLALLGVSPQSQDHLETQLRLLTTEQSRLLQEQAHRESLLALVRNRAPSYPKSALQLRQTVASRLGSHTVGALRQQLLRADVEYSALAFGEELLATASDRAQSLRQIVAGGHLARAERFAGSGRSAVLALVHVDRAQQLGLSSTNSDPTKVRDVAAASFAAAGRLVIRLRIQTNPSDEPILQDLARFAVTRSISQRSRPHIHIQTVSPYEKASEIQISVDSVKMFVPSVADLKPIRSTYLSHYEDVPNPTKAALKAQLDLQRISVDYALNSLNSAITSFNINPTQWTLQSVNSARTRYNMEVDTYNLVVQQYNLTSATIPRAVYLPYIFTEGTVRHGWQMSGSVRIGEVEERFSVEELDTDFVRIGTRPEDREVGRRRDNFLDIPVGTERLAQQLVKAADRVHERVTKAIRGLRIEVRSDLSEPERKLIAAALYPFTDTASRPSTAAPWADEVIQKMALPQIADRTIPTLKITPPKSRPRDATPEEIASFYAPVVALISSKDGAIGSGALISSDGLVLTAAHILRSEPIEVAFPRSADPRRHAASLVFVNETHDVAILRVTGYHSDRWFEIALSEGAGAGEPVVAMGNPAIGAAGTALSAISSGIVAKPYDANRSDGLTELVADIAIASGSSGGPLLSRRTGKIVGVVTAVVSPSISKDFATSGYWAVAAPSTELGKWLGIMYGP